MRGVKSFYVFDVTGFIWAFTIIVLLVTVAYPLAMLFYGAFTSDGRLSFAAIKRVFTDPLLPKYTLNTVRLAAVVTVFATLIGVALAWIVVRTDVPGKGIIRALAILPFIFPPYIGAIAWVCLADPVTGLLNRVYRLLGFGGYLVNIYSFWGLVTVMTFRFYVYTFLTTSAALEQIDPSLEEAARVCGARMSRVALDVTLRLVVPSILAGAILTFVAVAENFGIPAIIGSRARYYVLTYKIYSLLSLPDLEGAAAYSIVLLAISVPLLALQRFITRRERRYVTVTGRATRPSLMNLGRFRIPIFIAVVAFLIPTTIVPMASLILYAFLKNIAANPFDPSSYTLENFLEILFLNPDTRTAIMDSLFLATTAATTIVLFATLLSYLIVRSRTSAKILLDWLASAPFTLPGTVFAVAMIFAFIKTPLYNTLTLVLLAYFARYLAYGVRTITGSLLQIDPTLEEAGRVSGASWLQTMKDIVIPLLKASIVAGWILVFMPTLSELTVSIILAPPTQPTIGVATYNLMEEGQYEWAYAMATIVVAIVITGHTIVNTVTKKLGVKTA